MVNPRRHDVNPKPSTLDFRWPSGKRAFARKEQVLGRWIVLVGFELVEAQRHALFDEARQLRGQPRRPRRCARIQVYVSKTKLTRSMHKRNYTKKHCAYCKGVHV
jgi:hypothetical protein